jgi:predicted site-specific integrase-resolvase
MALKLGVHPQTLRRWERTGKLPAPERTLGNHRRYRAKPTQADAVTVGYVRVSSHDQKSDLERQKQFVTENAGKPVDLVISDLGSGLNYKKTGFKRLLLLILQGKVSELILTHKDRLLRFGSEIIFQICQFMGVKITILKAAEQKPAMEQFCTDLIEIMTVFCSKIYGQRSHQNRKCSTLSKNTPTAC